MPIFVNRAAELKCVDSLVFDNNHKKRMAVVCADERMGKTALLEHIYHRYSAHAVVFIDIGQKYEILPLIHDMAAQLGVPLPDYEGPVNVQISDIQATNSAINIAVGNTSSSRQEADRLFRELLKAVEAASSPSRNLVLIDGYEHARRPLRDWMIKSFISGILYQNATICILAGCREPKLSIAQRGRSDRLPLPGLNEDAIDQWLKAAGVDHTRAQATFLWKGTAGVPGKVDEFIINLMGP